MNHKVIRHLFDTIKREGIEYCIINGWKSLLEKNHSDVDIIVAAKDLAAIERCLRACRDLKLVQMVQHETSCYYYILAVQAEDGLSFIRLNTGVDCRRDGRLYFTARELLAGRKQWTGLWIAAPEVEFTCLLVKKDSKGVLSIHKKVRLKELRRQLGEEAHCWAQRLFGKRWGYRVMEWLDNSDWASWEAHMPVLKRSLRRQVLRRNPLNPVKFRVAEIRRIWRRGCYPTGLFVAVLGPDGSGKSTLIQNLQRTFAHAFPRTTVFHLRPYLLGRKTDGGPQTDPHGKPPRSSWLSMLKILYYMLDYILSYPLGIRLRLVRSTIVLFDRYYDDLLVDPRRYRYGGPMSLVGLGSKFIPKPDLFLILDLAAKQIMARKQEVSPKEIRRQLKAYRKLASKLPNAILLDGSLPAETVACHAQETLLDYLHQRYLKRRQLRFPGDGDEAFGRLLAALGFSSRKLL